MLRCLWKPNSLRSTATNHHQPNNQPIHQPTKQPTNPPTNQQPETPGHISRNMPSNSGTLTFPEFGTVPNNWRLRLREWSDAVSTNEGWLQWVHSTVMVHSQPAGSHSQYVHMLEYPAKYVGLPAVVGHCWCLCFVIEKPTICKACYVRKMRSHPYLVNPSCAMLLSYLAWSIFWEILVNLPLCL